MNGNLSLKLLLVFAIFGLAFSLNSRFPNCDQRQNHVEIAPTNESLLPKKKFPCFLAIADTHIDTTISRTRYGSETGIDLWQSTVEKINKLIKTDHPKFIVLLGDLPWHAKRSQETQLISAR